MADHVSKFPTWDSFFATPSERFRTLGIEPARGRRYLLSWREKYRQGRWGPGGDFTDVESDGTAYLRVVQVPLPKGERAEATVLVDADKRSIITNVAKGAEHAADGDGALPVKFYELGRDTLRINGPGAIQMRGTEGQVAFVKPLERMWEIRRGVKRDGGERRRKEVRAKRAAEERRKARDAAGNV
jgi:IGR protein motif